MERIIADLKEKLVSEKAQLDNLHTELDAVAWEEITMDEEMYISNMQGRINMLTSVIELLEADNE